MWTIIHSSITLPTMRLARPSPVLSLIVLALLVAPSAGARLRCQDASGALLPTAEICQDTDPNCASVFGGPVVAPDVRPAQCDQDSEFQCKLSLEMEHLTVQYSVPLCHMACFFIGLGMTFTHEDSLVLREAAKKCAKTCKICCELPQYSCSDQKSEFLFTILGVLLEKPLKKICLQVCRNSD